MMNFRQISQMWVILYKIWKAKGLQAVYIDLFCGAGGTSTGVEFSKDENGEQVAKVIFCINHDKNAIASHAENHPDAVHYVEDIRTVSLYPIKKTIQKIRHFFPHLKIVLWASLECTQFSKAKGGLPRDADSRSLAEHLYRYLYALDPDYVQVENVEEFMSWGDLDENGKPISKDKGRLYKKWIREVRRFGYKYEYRILNAADFGAYTSRKRYFGQFAKYGLPISWPKPTHTKEPALIMEGYQKWKAVKDVLDLSIEGVSIFLRKKPLSEKTLERIYFGLIKFVAGGKAEFEKMEKLWEKLPKGKVLFFRLHPQIARQVFLSKYFSGHPESKNISIDGPAHTIKCKDNHALVDCRFLSAYYGTGTNSTSAQNPCPTVTTRDRFNIVSPQFLCSYNFKDKPKEITSPSPTLMTKDRLSLVSTRFFMNYYSGGGQLSRLDSPSPTLLANPKQRLVSCQFLDQQYGQSKPTDIDSPVGALTANPKYNLVECKPWIMDTNFGNIGSSVDVPSKVITANRKHHYLMNTQYLNAGRSLEDPSFTLIARMDKMPPYLVCTEEGQVGIEIYDTDSPMTVKIKEFMVMYGLTDIRMRMLMIPELKRIMGFPEDYVLIGTKAEQKKYIGNAVEVNMARVLCEALVIGNKQKKVA